MREMNYRFIVVVAFILGCIAIVSYADKEEKTTVKSPDSTTVAEKSKKVEVEGTQDEKTMLSLTIEELAAYNGTEGKPAYVAVEGVIYDVSDTKAWKKGKHKGYMAGTDITELIRKKSPHGEKVLKKRTVVGKIVPAENK